MDWLNDKKNQPIVITIAVVLILVVGVLCYFMYFKPADDGSGDVAAAQDPGLQNTSAMPDETTTSEAAAVPEPTANKSDANVVSSLEASREDPFLPIGYKPAKKTKKIKMVSRIDDFPFAPLPERYVPGKEKSEKVIKTPEPAQPVRRMSGLMINDRVFAVLETNGESQIVQPGDMLKDQLATVEKIEADRVILKTTSKTPRYITVRMAAAPRSETEAFYESAAQSKTNQSSGTGYSTNRNNMRNGPLTGDALRNSFPGRNIK